MRRPQTLTEIGDEIIAELEQQLEFVHPMHDRVLVRRIPEPERKSLIIVPEIAKKQTSRAQVLAVGPGVWRNGYFCKTVVKSGDVVLVPGAGNAYPDWEESDTILIQEGDIGAIVGEFDYQADMDAHLDESWTDDLVG